MNGLALSRSFYETIGKPALEQQFPALMSRMAIGLAGEGSECLGFDDELSRDHDWGPAFCIWLEKAYECITADYYRSCNSVFVKSNYDVF